MTADDQNAKWESLEEAAGEAEHELKLNATTASSSMSEEGFERAMEMHDAMVVVDTLEVLAETWGTNMQPHGALGPWVELQLKLRAAVIRDEMLETDDE